MELARWRAEAVTNPLVLNQWLAERWSLGSAMSLMLPMKTASPNDCGAPLW